MLEKVVRLSTTAWSFCREAVGDCGIMCYCLQILLADCNT